VVYLDGRGLPLGGPRFTLAVEQLDRRLVLTDGDRTFKPRPRGEGRPGSLVCQAEVSVVQSPRHGQGPKRTG
jgi:hypothetical protein